MLLPLAVLQLQQQQHAMWSQLVPQHQQSQQAAVWRLLLCLLQLVVPCLGLSLLAGGRHQSLLQQQAQNQQRSQQHSQHLLAMVQLLTPAAAALSRQHTIGII
jgi:hypothetical protein